MDRGSKAKGLSAFLVACVMVVGTFGVFAVSVPSAGPSGLLALGKLSPKVLGAIQEGD